MTLLFQDATRTLLGSGYLTRSGVASLRQQRYSRTAPCARDFRNSCAPLVRQWAHTSPCEATVCSRPGTPINRRRNCNPSPTVYHSRLCPILVSDVSHVIWSNGGMTKPLQKVGGCIGRHFCVVELEGGHVVDVRNIWVQVTDIPITLADPCFLLPNERLILRIACAEHRRVVQGSVMCNSCPGTTHKCEGQLAPVRFGWQPRACFCASNTFEQVCRGVCRWTMTAGSAHC